MEHLKTCPIYHEIFTRKCTCGASQEHKEECEYCENINCPIHGLSPQEYKEEIGIICGCGIGHTLTIENGVVISDILTLPQEHNQASIKEETIIPPKGFKMKHVDLSKLLESKIVITYEKA